MNFMHLYHEPQHHGRHGLIKRSYFISVLLPRIFLGFKQHCTAGWLVHPSAVILGGTCSKDTILLYICTCMYMHPFLYVCIYLHILRKTLEVLENYKPEVSMLPACLYPWEINCILLLLCIDLFLYPSVCSYLPDWTVKTRKSIKGLLQQQMER